MSKGKARTESSTKGRSGKDGRITCGEETKEASGTFIRKQCQATDTRYNVLIGAEMGAGWQKQGTFQQHSTSLNVFRTRKAR